MTSAAKRAANHDNNTGQTRRYQASAPEQLTLRQQYLRYNGFQYDTFAQANAEQEYSFAERDTLQIPPLNEHSLAPQPDDIPLVFPNAYYVDPRYKDRRAGSVFDELSEPNHALVYGEPGAGKSTLRLALESDARTFPNGTLVVTYEPGRVVESEVDQAMTVAADQDAAATDAHLRLLATALAVDLFIQIIEQFGLRRDLPTARQNDALGTLITTIEPRLKAVLLRLLRGEDTTDLWGFAWLWRRLDRPIVRPVVRTPQMRQWLEALYQGLASAEAPADGATMWPRALATARLWGFGRVFVLLDGLDTYWRQPPDMLRLLDPLLRLLPAFSAQDVSLKAFLPYELQEDVAQRLQAYGVADEEVRVVVLAWTAERLRDLVLTRYRAARSRRLSLSDLVDENEDSDFYERIDDMLIESAQGNPRRLLMILHELVEVHVADPDQPLERPITRAEWDTAVKRAAARMAT